jgi:hypothetical protein
VRKKKAPPKTRLSKRGRDRIKERMRGIFRNVTRARMNHEEEILAEAHRNFKRRFCYLGADWKLQDECDDRHPIPFPLRTDVHLRTVKTAVRKLIPEEADTLRQSIIESVKRFRKERGKQERWIESLFSIRELVKALYPFLKEIPVPTAAQILVELFQEEHDIALDHERFKKQLTEMRKEIKGKN